MTLLRVRGPIQQPVPYTQDKTVAPSVTPAIARAFASVTIACDHGVRNPSLREANVVPDFDFSAHDHAPDAGAGQLDSVDDIVDRAQRLIDSPRPYDGYPLEWHYEALNVGDLTAIAIAALRGSGSTRQ
jgi:hypothetical protein